MSIGLRLPQYYKRIEPADAHVLEKRLRPRKDADVNGSAPATAKAAKEEWSFGLWWWKFRVELSKVQSSSIQLQKEPCSLQPTPRRTLDAELRVNSEKCVSNATPSYYGWTELFAIKVCMTWRISLWLVQNQPQIFGDSFFSIIQYPISIFLG